MPTIGENELKRSKSTSTFRLVSSRIFLHTGIQQKLSNNKETLKHFNKIVEIQKKSRQQNRIREITKTKINFAPFFEYFKSTLLKLIV